MREELVYKVLLLNLRQRVVNIEANNLVGLSKLGLLHFHRAGVVLRHRTKLELASAAIGNITTRTPIGRGVAHRVHDGRHRSQTVAVDATIALSLHLPLNALQHFRHRLNIVETLVVFGQLGNDKRIVFVPIHQFKLCIVRNFLLAIHFTMEHRAVDPLRVVLFVNQSLIAIDDLIQLRRIVRHGGVSELVAPFKSEGVSRFFAVFDNVLHPVLIPAVAANLVTQFLRSH